MKQLSMSPEGRAWLARWEGTMLFAYDDFNDKRVTLGGRAIGTLTIGTGHTTAAGPPVVRPGMTITAAEADGILAADLLAVQLDVERFIHVELTQQQADAVIDFEYNTGWLGHPHCSLTDALNAGKNALAAQDFALYNRASGRVSRGLVKRRNAEMLRFTTGKFVYP